MADKKHPRSGKTGKFVTKEGKNLRSVAGSVLTQRSDKKNGKHDTKGISDTVLPPTRPKK